MENIDGFLSYIPKDTVLGALSSQQQNFTLPFCLGTGVKSHMNEEILEVVKTKSYRSLIKGLAWIGKVIHIQYISTEFSCQNYLAKKD